MKTLFNGKFLMLAICLTVFALFSEVSEALAAEFEVQVVVGDQKEGPKADSSAQHLLSALKNLQFNNFHVTKTMTMDVKQGESQKQSVGFGSLFLSIELLESGSKAKIKVVLSKVNKVIYEQTVKMSKGQRYFSVCPQDSKCVVLAITLTED